MAPKPFFLFDRARIRHNYREFLRLFPGSRVCYALKANSEPEVLKTLAEEGSSFVLASVQELHQLRVLGIAPERILYGSAFRPASNVAEFAAYGVRDFAVDSMLELEKLAAIVPRARVFIRAKVEDAGSQQAFSKTCGAETGNLMSLLLRARDLKLNPFGISFHVGTQSRNPQVWGMAIRRLVPVVCELEKRGLKLEAINIGGGFPCEYEPNECRPLDEIAKHTLLEYEKLPYELPLVIEPGRGLVADAAVLLTRVIAKVRRQGVGQTVLILDAGVFNAVPEALQRRGGIKFSTIALAEMKDRAMGTFDLVGPTGDKLDVVARSVCLPEETDTGAVLCIRKVGAYTPALTRTLNGFPQLRTLFI